MITIIDNILTKEECYELIGIASTRLEKMDVLKNDPTDPHSDGYRNADGAWLLDDSDTIKKVKRVVSNVTGQPVENQEAVHIVKYDVGGEYKAHHDYFHTNTNYYKSAMENGGQRIFSCLIYLNDNFTGGETEFPTKKLKFTPRAGRMVSWSNLKPDNTLDAETLHAGLPVTKGCKWIAVIWVRKDKRI